MTASAPATSSSRLGRNLPEPLQKDPLKDADRAGEYLIVLPQVASAITEPGLWPSWRWESRSSPGW